jgi:hypothetical protein
VSDASFRADAFQSLARGTLRFRQPRLRIIGTLAGRLEVRDGVQSVELNAGEFCLIPGGVKKPELAHETGSSFLLVEPGDRAGV